LHWQTVSSKKVYQSKRLKIRLDKVICPSGRSGTYEVIDRKSAVLVIPKINNQFFLVEQYRYPIKARSLEFPQGSIEEGETVKQAAKRELQEEVGLRTDSLVKLGFIYYACGQFTQGATVFLANNCRASKQALEDTELDIVVYKHSLSSLKEIVKANKIKDSATLAAFGLILSQE